MHVTFYVEVWNRHGPKWGWLSGVGRGIFELSVSFYIWSCIFISHGIFLYWILLNRLLMSFEQFCFFCIIFLLFVPPVPGFPSLTPKFHYHVWDYFSAGIRRPKPYVSFSIQTDWTRKERIIMNAIEWVTISHDFPIRRRTVVDTLRTSIWNYYFHTNV